MEPKIILIAEVAAIFRVATSTIYRWLAESRAGRGSFPPPISRQNAKLRWRTSDIERYIEAQSKVPPIHTSPAKQEKDYDRRQAAAKATLAKHGIKQYK